MTLSQFFLIVSARKKLLALSVLIPLLLVGLMLLVMPKTYTATSTVILNPGIDPVTGNALPGQLIPSYLATQVGIIESKNVAQQVVKDLQLDANEKYRESFEDAANGNGNLINWIAERILKETEVKPERDSNVIHINYSDTNPQMAASIANAIASAYQKINMDLRLEPAKRASNYFNENLKNYRAQFEAAQNRLSQYQQEKGITNLDHSLDIETVRLNELSTQLVSVQNQLMEARSRLATAKGSDAVDSPDVIANPTVQNLRLTLAEAETKLTRMGERFTQNHPQYIEAKNEVNTIKRQLRLNAASASTGIAKTAEIAAQREAELSAAVAEQKNKVLQLNRARDQLYVLNKEVESSQKAYEGVLQRLSQSKVESQSGLSEVTILSQAVAPDKASSPKPLLYLLLSILAGAFVGIGLSMIAEMLDRRVRTTNDLHTVLDAPVLGTITWGAPKREPLSLPKWKNVPLLNH